MQTDPLSQCCLAASAQHHASAQPLSTRINMASINLHNFIEPPLACYEFDNIYSHSQWQKKCAWFSEWLQEHQPDIVGFQEVFSQSALAELAKLQGLVHFAVVDTPQVLADYIYCSPVVALASRYPIVDVSPVTADASVAMAMGLSAEFAFSRKVLRATIDIPQLGLCDCYVTHLKSKRPNVVPTDSDALKVSSRVVQLLKAQALGRWAATIQRGTEAALLLNSILIRRQVQGYPVMVMGDFNDSLTAAALDALTLQGSEIHSGDIRAAGLGKLSDKALAALFADYQLHDAYDLQQAANLPLADPLTGVQRPSTHYHGATGSVLDYILLSSEFDAGYGCSLAQVVEYHTCNRHLLKADYDRDAHSTDHAPIMVRLAIRA